MDEHWVELRLEDLPRAHLESVSARLFGLGASGLQEEWPAGARPPLPQPWDDATHQPEPDPLVLRAFFDRPDRRGIEREMTDVPATCSWMEVGDHDWSKAWRSGLTPIVISERLTITPPWHDIPGALVIEPGQGFGTGHHPTTVQALQAIDAVAGGVADVLDVGCGSGILALAAARMGAEVEGIDVDPASVREADRHAARNDLRARFSTTPLAMLLRPRGLVVANLHAELIVTLAPDLLRLTGDWLVLAGILADREDGVRRALDPHLTLADRHADGEWVSLRYRRTA